MKLTGLDQLQALLTKVSISRLKDEFIEGAIENLDNISKIDNNEGIIYVMDDNGEDFPYRFTDDLDRKLSEIYESTKIELEEAFNTFEGTNLYELKKQVKRQVNVIIRPQKFVFTAYPSCNFYLGMLIQYLNDIHKLGLSNPFLRQEEEYLHAPFRVKKIYDKTTNFDKLYRFLVAQDIILSIELAESDFYRVMSGASTNKQIVFIPSNAVVAQLLNSISHIYVKFNGSIIEKSRRFVTNRNNSPMTQGNYNTSKTRLRSADDSKLIKKIYKAIKDIFPVV